MPMTLEQHRASLHQPAFSELLPVRDILNDVIIRTTGALVAGYELSGINSYYHNDDGRNRTKLALEALIRSLPERSMRMQVRFEIAEGLGDLRERYQQQLRNQNPTLLALDRMRIDAWRKKEQEGYYLRPLLVWSKYSNLLEPRVMVPPHPNGFWKTLRANSEPCNVMLRAFRISSLGRHVQPTNVIGFRQIEFFDHTRCAGARRLSK